MKQFFIVDNSGMGIFQDDRYEGAQTLSPGVSTHQEMVQVALREGLRRMVKRLFVWYRKCPIGSLLNRMVTM